MATTLTCRRSRARQRGQRRWPGVGVVPAAALAAAACIFACAARIATATAAAAPTAPTHRFYNLTMDLDSLGSSGAAVRGELLLFGGGKAPTPSGASDSVISYDGFLTSNPFTIHKGVLSAARGSLAATATSDGSHAFFAGGEFGAAKTKVGNLDVLSVNPWGTWMWQVLHLSQPRSFLAAAAITAPNGSQYALFGGGEVVEGVHGSDSARVDIVEVPATGNVTMVWSGDSLSTPRKKLAAATAGRFVLFGGGYTSGRKDEPTRGYDATVDIWDSNSSEWSTANLTQPRQYVVAAGAGGMAVFAGGFCSPCLGTNGTTDRSDVVDVFDAATQTWTSAVLSQRRSNLAATAVGDRWIVIAGGTSDLPSSGSGSGGGGADIYRSTAVDIFDTTTREWSTSRLGAGRCSLGAAGGNRTAVFLGGSVGTAVDIFGFE